MTDRNTKLIFLTYAVLFIIACYLASVYLDPDFGWRIQIGKYILSNGIPKTDIYSYTMPSFPLVDHEWLTHIGLSTFFSVIGYRGLAVLSALILLGTVGLVTKTFPRSWRIAHVLLVAVVLLHYYGIKPQIISWLFTSVLVIATLDSKWKSRWMYCMPFFFLLWANIHGGFVFGIGIYALNIIADTWEHRRLDVRMALIFLLSVGATFINPYGWRLWEELIRTGSDARLRWQIQEWTPQFLSFSVSSFVIVSWYLVILLKYWKYSTSYERILVIITLILGFSSSRNFPLWVIASSPVIARLFMFFVRESGKNRVTKERIHTFSVVFSIITLALVIFELVFLTKEMKTYSEQNKYPGGAIEYLRTHPDSGNMLAAYEWGGYLIWKYPEKKVFIDGLMPSWRQSASAHPTESADALGEFTSFLTQQTPMKKTLHKYHITTILLPVDFLKPAPKPLTNTYKEKFKDALKKNNFQIVYSDKVAIVYR